MRRVKWSMLLLAALLLVPVLAGVAMVLGGSDPLGWGLIGFFGAGAVVLGRQAFSGE